MVNLSAGVSWDSGLELVAYVNNLFDENAKLSFDRERGGRARLGYNIGTPRTIGLTARYKFASRPEVSAATSASPAPSAAASGDADLRGRLGDPGDGCVPAAASASAPAAAPPEPERG